MVTACLILFLRSCVNVVGPPIGRHLQPISYLKSQTGAKRSGLVQSRIMWRLRRHMNPYPLFDLSTQM